MICDYKRRIYVNKMTSLVYSTLNGFVDLKLLTKKVVSQNYQLNDSIEKAIFHKFYRVKEDTILGLASRLLETEGFVAVVDGDNHIIGAISHLKLLNFIANGQKTA